ncbi:MAG TPA: trypsin-like serine protease [Myxococcaceae bacterium]|nr:trypsin-like serine protease [Myxococcaceae bacterium]
MKKHILGASLALLCLMGTGCSGASRRETAGPRLSSEAHVSQEKPRPSQTEMSSPDREHVPSKDNLELQDDRHASVVGGDGYYRMSSANARVVPPFSEMTYAVIDGQRDSRDSYKSTVKVEFSEDGNDFCSGVLLNPYLVLSAAHCFCAKTPPATAMNIDRRSARCDMHVSAVKAFTYKPTKGKTKKDPGSGNGKEQASSPTRESKPLISKGEMEIEIHPDYMSVYDSNGRLSGSRVDLVVIHLTEPISSGATQFRVPTDKGRARDKGREVEVEEVLEIVGYGETGPGAEERFVGERYYGSNIVKVVSSEANPVEQREAKIKDGVFMFVGEGPDGKKAHVADGDSGGPCFAQRDNERWLVGIISMGSDDPASLPFSLFTSTYVHRKWIDEQKAKSEKRIKKLKRRTN